MSQINYGQIPTKAPGTLFDALSGADQQLLVRYFVAADPVHYDALNRPLKDIEVRQMVIAKAVDVLQSSTGARFYYPFLVQPYISAGTDSTSLPIGWIWDMHMSFPENWETLRLAKIIRISGANGTSGYTGILRFMFTANRKGSNTEVAVMYADYNITSDLTYQLTRLQPVISGTPIVLTADERAQFSGFLTFLTLHTSQQTTLDVLNILAPPTDTSVDGLGYYLYPAVYEISDSTAGGTTVTGDYDLSQISHGTGVLADSALNTIPSQTVGSQGLLNALNYPFDTDANLISVNGVVVPQGLFSEFTITAPAGDEPTGDNSGAYYPVWMSRIERVGTGVGHIRLYFSTYNVTDTTPSQTPIEFAFMDLLRSYATDRIVAITPNLNLKGVIGTDAAAFTQHFGRGHSKLSNLWDGTNPQIDDLFDAMSALGAIDNTVFTKSSGRLSALSLNRVPKYIPTMGQNEALSGTTGIGRRSTPYNPNNNNRYITEADSGLGEETDLESVSGISPNQAIGRFGYSATRSHSSVYMQVDQQLVDGSDDNFYGNVILPRLRALFGRDPIFMDMWYDGSRILFYNGDTWQSP